MLRLEMRLEMRFDHHISEMAVITALVTVVSNVDDAGQATRLVAPLWMILGSGLANLGTWHLPMAVVGLNGFDGRNLLFIIKSIPQ